jgi:hypothetical protein
MQTRMGYRHVLHGNLQKGYWADPPALPDLLNGYLRRLLSEEVARLKLGVADLMREVVTHLEGVVSEQAMQAGFRHDATKAEFSGRVQSARAAARCVCVCTRQGAERWRAGAREMCMSHSGGGRRAVGSHGTRLPKADGTILSWRTRHNASSAAWSTHYHSLQRSISVAVSENEVRVGGARCRTAARDEAATARRDFDAEQRMAEERRVAATAETSASLREAELALYREKSRREILERKWVQVSAKECRSTKEFRRPSPSKFHLPQWGSWVVGSIGKGRKVG